MLVEFLVFNGVEGLPCLKTTDEFPFFNLAVGVFLFTMLSVVLLTLELVLVLFSVVPLVVILLELAVSLLVLVLAICSILHVLLEIFDINLIIEPLLLAALEADAAVLDGD